VPAGNSAGYEVLTGELQAHAARVDGLVDRLRAAVDAASQVTMNDSAYGVICQPFAMLLQPFEQMGVNALNQAATTVRESAAGVRDTARVYDTTEGTEATRFGRIDV
jgi:Excreted virulence factor EspC, type VII ESX diderm